MPPRQPSVDPLRNPWLESRVRSDESLARGNHERNFTHSPADLASDLLADREMVASGNMPHPLTFGIQKMDERITRIWGGRYVVVMGRPSHGKTLLLIHMARRECQRIMRSAKAEGRDLADTGEYVLFVSMEEDRRDVALKITNGTFSMEDVFQGRRSPDDLRQAAAETLDWPLWILTDNMTRAAQARGGLTNTMTPGRIWSEIAAIEREHGMRPSAIFVDYLQELGGGGSVFDQVRRNAEALRTMARRLGVPVILASQAKRSVDDQAQRGRWPIPESGDSEWSAKAEQAADVLLSVAMPYRWPLHYLEEIAGIWQPGGEGGPAYPIDDNLFIVRLLKQRGAHGSGLFTVGVDHGTGTLHYRKPGLIGAAEKPEVQAADEPGPKTLELGPLEPHEQPPLVAVGFEEAMALAQQADKERGE